MSEKTTVPDHLHTQGEGYEAGSLGDAAQSSGPGASGLPSVGRSEDGTDQALQPPIAPAHGPHPFDAALEQTLTERIYHLRLEFDVLRAWYAPPGGTGQWARTDAALKRVEEVAK